MQVTGCCQCRCQATPRQARSQAQAQGCCWELDCCCRRQVPGCHWVLGCRCRQGLGSSQGRGWTQVQGCCFRCHQDWERRQEQDWNQGWFPRRCRRGWGMRQVQGWGRRRLHQGSYQARGWRWHCCSRPRRRCQTPASAPLSCSCTRRWCRCRSHSQQRWCWRAGRRCWWGRAPAGPPPRWAGQAASPGGRGTLGCLARSGG